MRSPLHLLLVSAVLALACWAPGTQGSEIKPAPVREIGDVLDPGSVRGSLWVFQEWLVQHPQRCHQTGIVTHPPATDDETVQLPLRKRGDAY
jgi:hypothetical protein